MDLCISRGADDFHTAEKIATFNLNSNVIMYIIRSKIEGPPSRYLAEEWELEYYFYYDLLTLYPYQPRATKRLARRTLVRALGDSYFHPSPCPDLLDMPMSQWSNQSLFRHIAVLEVNALFDMSFASLYTSDFAPQDDDSYSDSEYDSDDLEMWFD